LFLILSCSNVQNRDCAADVVNIKISKFGGLTKAKQAIDLCSDLGIAMTIEGRGRTVGCAAHFRLKRK
jgi:L-alanine-DL-glutamate epimerase-like enolase superfamily enzyme